MDLHERPYIAACSTVHTRRCSIWGSLDQLQPPRMRAARWKRSEAIAVLNYAGISIAGLSMKSMMVAQEGAGEGGQSRLFCLAVPVPGVLEGRPGVAFGSRVHITYKVCLAEASFD